MSRPQTEQDGPETDHPEPATLDRGSTQRWNIQPDHPSGLDRGFTEDSDREDEMDPQRSSTPY